MRSIITISREFGSGGREIGKKLADDLGIPFYDKELLVRTMSPILTAFFSHWSWVITL